MSYVRHFRIMVAAFAAFMAASEVQAQMTASAVRSACRGEYWRYCSGVLPGGGRIAACLDRHIEALNRDCAAAVLLVSRCAGDYRRLCAGVTPGSGEVRACLSEHRAQLSAPCAAIVAKSAGN